MNQEDRERMVRIEVGLGNLKETLEKQVVGRINDHGNRLRALEVLRNQVAGGLALIGAIAALSHENVSSWFNRHIGK